MSSPETKAPLDAERPPAEAPKADPGPPRPAPSRNIYTMHAREGVNAAELLNSAFKKRVVGKLVQRRIELTAPSGPSTSGGKLARQSITLTPVSGMHPAIMLGHIDVTQKAASLRAYEVIARQYASRFRTPLDISAEELVPLLKDVDGMLGTLGFSVEQDSEIEPELMDRKPSTGGTRIVLYASVAVCVLVALMLLAR